MHHVRVRIINMRSFHCDNMAFLDSLQSLQGRYSVCVLGGGGRLGGAGRGDRGRWYGPLNPVPWGQKLITARVRSSTGR